MRTKRSPTTMTVWRRACIPGVKPGHTFVLVNKAGRIVWRWDWIGHGKPMYVEADDLYSDVAERLERSG